MIDSSKMANPLTNYSLARHKQIIPTKFFIIGTRTSHFWFFIFKDITCWGGWWQSFARYFIGILMGFIIYRPLCMGENMWTVCKQIKNVLKYLKTFIYQIDRWCMMLLCCFLFRYECNTNKSIKKYKKQIKII